MHPTKWLGRVTKSPVWRDLIGEWDQWWIQRSNYAGAQVPRRYNKWGPTSPYNGSQYAFCYVAKIVQSPVESNLGWEIVKLLKG